MSSYQQIDQMNLEQQLTQQNMRKIDDKINIILTKWMASHLEVKLGQSKVLGGVRCLGRWELC